VPALLSCGLPFSSCKPPLSPASSPPSFLAAFYQTFSALDRAQRKLGFHHADLGMRNIMEHYPRYGGGVNCWQNPRRCQRHAVLQAWLCWGAAGCIWIAAAHRCRTEPFLRTPGELFQRCLPLLLPRLGCRIWEDLSAQQGQQAEAEAKKFPGYSCTADGKRLPLGPQLEVSVCVCARV
jgi:hypothetical protein